MENSNGKGWTTRARELKLWRELLNFFLHQWGTVECTKEFLFKENVGTCSPKQDVKIKEQCNINNTNNHVLVLWL